MLETRPTRSRWVQLAWLSAMGAVSYLDRVNISIAAKPMADQYHLSLPRLGMVFSAFSIGYSLFQVPGGWLADRLGPRKVLAMGAIAWAILTALSGLVPVSWAMALIALWTVRLLLGVGESVMYPASNLWVAFWIPTAERGIANGLIFAGVGTGAAFAPPLVAAIMTRWGWRSSFLICSTLGWATAFIWYAVARNRPEDHPRANRLERELIQRGIVTTASAASRPAPWKSIFSSFNVWALTLSYFAYGYVAYIFFTWFFIYLTTVRGLSVQSGSLYAMLPFIGMTLGSVTGGWVSDRISLRFGRRIGRCGTGVLGLGLCSLLLLIGAQVHTAASASVILAAGAGSLYLAQSSYWALSADIGGSHAGSLSGWMNMGAQSGSAITAVLTPIIAIHFGWATAIILAAALCALGALAWLVIDPSHTLHHRGCPAE